MNVSVSWNAIIAFLSFRNRSGVLLKKEMDYYEKKFELFKLPKPYALESLALLLEFLGLQIRIVSRKLKKVNLAFPPEFSCEKYVLFGLETPNENRPSHVDLLLKPSGILQVMKTFQQK